MNINERRKLFEEFKKNNTETFNELIDEICDITCPCCGFPTQTQKGSFEICPLCSWEDDGQDDPHAESVWGGANDDYSLAKARENFEKYCTMYQPHDERFFESIAKLTFNGDIIVDKIEIKIKIIQKFYKLYKQTDKIIIKKIFNEINDLLWSRKLL